jgi:hypothetical protein
LRGCPTNQEERDEEEQRSSDAFYKRHRHRRELGTDTLEQNGSERPGSG